MPLRPRLRRSADARRLGCWVLCLVLCGWSSSADARSATGETERVWFCGEHLPRDIRVIDCERPVEDLAALRAFKRLEILDMDACRATDLRPLASLKRLRELRLPGLSATDLRPIGALSQLERLSLPRGKFGDIGFLRRLTRLRELNLYRTRITDIGPVAGLRGLESLVFGATRVRSLQPLAGLSNLRYLSFNQSPVDDLTPIARLPLEHLSAAYTRVSSIVPLARHVGIRWLELGHSRVRDLERLPVMPRLEYLDLAHVPIPTLRFLGKCGALRTAVLSASGLKAIGRLARCRHLRSLFLGRTQVTSLRGLDMAEMRYLVIAHTRVRDLAVLSTTSKCALRGLDVSFSAIRDLGLLPGCPLEELRVRKARALPRQSVEALRQAHPGLRVFD